MMVQGKSGSFPALTVGRTSVAVTAVTITDDNSVIAAYSSYLVNLKTKQRLKVFQHQAVHALYVSNSSLLVCGGRSISIVDISRDSKMSISSPERRLKDWIISAVWMSEKIIAVLFSYNSVAILDSSTLASVQDVQCDSCCIIYGGCLVVEEGVLVCCSGTVFNKPLLWKPLLQSKVIMSYEGHSGVIFDIKLTRDKLYSVSDDRTLIIWNRVSGEIEHRLYGHTARVLKVVLMSWCEGVVTVGEDNQCIIWSRETGEKFSCITPHSGNGIRSVCCKNNTVVTGGWDSTVVKYSLSSRYKHPQQNFKFSLDKDPPKWVSWITGERLLVQLSSGEVRVYDSALSDFKVVMSSAESGFKGYSTYCELSGVVIVGGITGRICLLDSESLRFSYVNCDREGKIFSLTAVSCEGSDRKLFISCQESGNLVLWEVSECLSAKPLKTYVLPKCRNRWLTSACTDESGEFLVVGDRRGGVHLYPLKVTSSEGKSPLFSISGLHGENGISQLTTQQNLVVTVGRDGNVRHLKFEKESLVIVKKYKPMSGVYWVEKLEQKGGLTLMHYFHGQQFKMTVLESGETIFCVECGGGHRSWDAHFDGSFVHFAYVKNPQIKVVKQRVTPNLFKRHGSLNHGSEINSAIYYRDLIVTAGEDCSLIAHSQDHSLPISSHISSIRSLCVSDCGLLFSTGGRGSLKAWHIPPDRTDLELVSDYTVVSNTHIPVGYNSSYRFDQRNSDNDQRVMSVDCCKSTDSQFVCLVACGLSNGEVYLLGYTPDCRFIRILSHYQHNCITRVKLTVTCPETGTLLLLLSTTFGMVEGLNIQGSAIDSKFSCRLHSSGINGLDLRLGPSAEVLTIGDDGDVIRSSLSASDSRLDSITPLARQTTHFSAGIAVRFLNTDRFITVGSDQRLFVLDTDLQPVYCCYVDVPDPHDLVISNSTSYADLAVLVCGKGLQEFIM